MARTIKSYNDLTPDQIEACRGVWKKATSTLPGAKFDDDDITKFWTLVFKAGWTSAIPAMKPKYPNRSVTESMVYGGRFINNQNVGDAFLQVALSKAGSDLWFVWVDKDGNRIPSTVQSIDSPTEMELRRYAVLRYDEHEKERLASWNTKLAAYIVRLRIRAWAPGRILNVAEMDKDKELFEQFEDIVLARSVLQRYAADYWDVKIRVEASRGHDRLWEFF
ncbi:hypothetical protein F4780DRAFT_67566 [Xylariomycetidae sp. FL0641]|nr:hypothetical protein F4780DRAFT_67566 [Xylariomycetidae sp. FL0641]